MDVGCQMTLVRPSISSSLKRPQGHPVRVKGGPSAPCPAMVVTVDYAMGWGRRLYQWLCDFVRRRQSTALGREIDKACCRSRGPRSDTKS